MIVVLIDGKMSITLVDATLLKSNQNQAEKLMRMLCDTEAVSWLNINSKWKKGYAQNEI